MKDELTTKGVAGSAAPQDAAEGTRCADARTRWAARLRRVQGYRERRRRAAETIARQQRSNRVH